MTTSTRILIALVAASSVGCASNTLDAHDRQPFFFDARVRKNFEPSEGDKQLHIEGAWTRAAGSTNELDYSIHTVNVGAGVDAELGEHGWSAVAAGISFQRAELDTDAVDANQNTGVGLYAAVEGGWHATSIVEPYARLEGALYLVEFSTMLSLEAGARFHVVEHAALFAGWRYARFNIRDVDGAFTVDEIDLDTSGIVVGLASRSNLLR
ncbi:MAG: hypothetical protein SGI72_18240 [Planctomycetota bacterium]|nr:hypothetical protein [Planctomycetota bacterium]